MRESPEQPPGLRRRILLYPFAGRIVAALEDDLHRFTMQMTHASGIVIGVQARAERYPWSTCADAPGLFAEQTIGRTLERVAQLDSFSHCTHLFELGVLCAAHVGDTASTRFDLEVDDWRDNRSGVRLLNNGRLVLAWQLNGGIIETPGEWCGRDLLRLPHWRQELDPTRAELAMLTYRAVIVSRARALKDGPAVEHPADRGPLRLGVCFAYQMPRAQEGVRPSNYSWRDFSRSSDEPLQDFDLESPA